MHVDPSEILRSRHRSGSRPTLYLQHAPGLGRFDHLADRPGTGHHSGGPSPSPISEPFRRVGHVASEVSPRGTRPCRSASRRRDTLPGARLRDFRRQNAEAPPYRCGRVRSLFGTVSHTSHQQALAGRSPLNFSRPKDFPPVPEVVEPRSVCLAAAELPALAYVERTSSASMTPEARTPRVDSAARRRVACAVVARHGGRADAPETMLERGKRRRRSVAASPTSRFTAARSRTVRSVSVVPPPATGSGHAWDRMNGLT